MMEVVVETLVAQRDFGVIFSATVVSEDSAHRGIRIRVRALNTTMSGTPAAGEAWLVDGEILNGEYGPQVDARSAIRRLPTGVLIRGFLAANVPGIGHERAGRLWSSFGETLATVLDDPANVGRIAAILAPDRPLLALRLAAATVSGWQVAKAEAGLVAWLDAQGVGDVKLARRIGRMLGGDAVERLRDNPYVLVPLLPWATVDGLGVRLLAMSHAAPEDDVRRWVGAVDEAVKRTLRKGDTALTGDDLLSAVGETLSASPGSNTVASAVAAGVRNEAILRAGDFYRAPGAALMEEAVAARLRALGAAGPIRPILPSRLAEMVADAALPSMPLHPDQAAAASFVLGRQVACLSGGAGTGKTYTCRIICDAWERLGGVVLPCALAGKAALRLSRSIRRQARTLARTLAELGERERIEERLEDGSLDAGERAKLVGRLDRLAEITPGTMVLVDEASMVDVATVYALTRRMPDGARLLMVGDEAQLPPVGPGLVYHLLVQDRSITAKLTHVHRQAAATGIPAVGEALRRRSMPKWPRYVGPRDGVSFVEVSGDGLGAKVEEIAIELGILSRDVLIVTATNGGPAGVRTLNERLQARHVAESGLDPLRGPLARYFAERDPVIFGRNDYRLGLFNGLLGRVTATLPAERMLDVHFDGEAASRRLGAEHLVDLELAYAVTCHKCQGSSAPRIVIPIYRTAVLDPSWLYTAVTRAERQVVLVGDGAVLKKALDIPLAANARRVGFRWLDPSP